MNGRHAPARMVGNSGAASKLQQAGDPGPRNCLGDHMSEAKDLLLAIDQGTQSVRAMIFDPRRTPRPVEVHIQL